MERQDSKTLPSDAGYREFSTCAYMSSQHHIVRDNGTTMAFQEMQIPRGDQHLLMVDATAGSSQVKSEQVKTMIHSNSTDVLQVDMVPHTIPPQFNSPCFPGNIKCSMKSI